MDTRYQYLKANKPCSIYQVISTLINITPIRLLPIRFFIIAMTLMLLSKPTDVRSQENKKLDSLKHVSIQSLDQKANIFFLISDIFGKQKEYDSAARYALQAYETLKETGNTQDIPRFGYRLSLWMYATKQYDQSLEFAYDALSYTNEKTNQDIRANLNLGIAKVAIKQGDQLKAMDFLIKAMEKEDSKEVKPLTRAKCYEYLTNIHMDLEHYEKALEYSKKARNAYKQLNHAEGQQVELIKTGMIYDMLDIHHSAEASYKKALQIAFESGQKHLLIYIHSRLGYHYQKTRELDKAISAFKNEIDVAFNDGDTTTIAAAHCSLGGAYIINEQLDLADSILCAAKTLLLYSQTKKQNKAEFELMSNIALSLSNIDSLQGNHKTSLAHYKESVAYKDSLKQVQKIASIEKLRVGYESERQDKDIELLAAKNKVQMAQHRKEQDLMVASIIGAILLIFLLILIYKQYMLKNKAFNTIKEQKTDIEIRHSINEKLINEIHHRVKNNLQIMLSMLNTQGYLLKNDDRAKSIIKESQNRIRSLALIHNNLHQSGRYLIVSAKQYIEDLVIRVKENFGQKAQHIELITDVEDTEISMNFAVPLGLIINELSTNALKHAFRDQSTEPTLTVKFAKTGTGLYELTLCDNGIGLPPGFDMTCSNNFGLHIVNGLTQQLQGEMTASSDYGTCFNFTLKDEVIKEKKSERQHALSTV
ncbi:MAG: histidine kinase dimerization/phosphoacceptor domain -containing protein [Bacteroidota bacterium]